LELLVEEEGRSMAAWPHSGFHVHHSVRLEADDPCGILQLARYAARAPLGLERLRYDARRQQVLLQSDKSEGPTAGTHVFPALDFLALLLTHIPDCHERLIRAYGAYSVRRRARWRRDGVLTNTPPLAASSREAEDALPAWPALRAMQQRWAELLKRIFEADPLACPRCGATMRIVSFIRDGDVINAILRHLRHKGCDPRALPGHAVAGRAPP
jgi:hypothetical protein